MNGAYMQPLLNTVSQLAHTVLVDSHIQYTNLIINLGRYVWPFGSLAMEYLKETHLETIVYALTLIYLALVVKVRVLTSISFLKVT